MQTTAYRARGFSPTQILRFPADLVRNWFVISSLVRRELKGKYLNSAIGAAWTVINPLFMLVVYTTVFSAILEVRWEGTRGEIPLPHIPEHLRFALMMYCGITPWLAFSESVNRGAHIVMENSNLIKKVAFPSESLPVYVVLYTLVNELIGFAILMVALPILGAPVPLTVLWLPLIVFLRLLFTLGVVYVVATANVFVRDVGQMVGLLLLLWMFLTPIFYAEEHLQKADLEWAQKGMSLNPWYYIVNMYRDIFLRGENPDPVVMLTILGIGLGTFIVGYAMFMSSKTKFSDEI